jgi:hypothetical protein
MMNINRNLRKHMELWQSIAGNSFAPAYPTSIRGLNELQTSPGIR